ncbi:hypothetical protein ASG01_06710 [Chryseobacterium sp. Leaf180]|nr:hypothetical protein ASG01_06710 [Chryseobacterium sp. Leaf180]
MLFVFGPFHIIVFLIIYFGLFVCAAYCFVKNKLSALWALAILFFPVAGSLIALLYHHYNRRENNIDF